MDSLQDFKHNPQQVGDAWIQSVVEKDFQHLAEICQPGVFSRLMTPKRIDSYESAADLIQKVAIWFGECSSFQKDQIRISMVGEKLAIFYRLSFDKNGQSYTAEQQVYCSLRDGLIDQVSLLCSGFQPVPVMAEAPTAMGATSTQAVQRNTLPASLQADAFLKVDTSGGQGSACALLTPAIKRKLVEMNSGQVLEVHVDEPSAKEDIEAWCRLSGNSLLKMDQDSGLELSFYLMKK